MITTEIIPLEEMKKKIDKGFICQECNNPLSVAYGGKWGVNFQILRCTKDVNHNGIMRPFEVSGYDLPGYNMPGTINAKMKALKKEFGNMVSTELAKQSGNNVLSVLDENRARAIILTIWPGAPEVEVKKAAIVCAQYGLNPLMKHLYLIPFNTKNGDKWEKSYSMVLGIKASRIIARRKGEYAYLDDTPRIMTADEQIKIFGEVDQLNVCAITRLSDRKGNSAIGTGRWPKETAVKGAEKGNTKLNMAMIRSERQALERLFPDSLPSEVTDVVDERYEDMPAVNVNVEKPAPLAIEQPADEIEPGDSPEPVKEEQATVTDSVKPEMITPEQIEKLKAINQKGTKLLPKIKELGFENIKQISDLTKDEAEKLLNILSV